MIPFNKLVQAKRSKMLVLVVLLVFCVCLRPTTSINLTYIVKKEGDVLQPNCIAEENTRYAGIGWVFPIPDEKENLPNITRKFVPTITNDFNCNFSKLDKCTKIWMIKNWQIDADSTRTFDLISDERWDDFPLIFTSNNSPEFADRIEIHNIFRVGFSLRASKNVEILACEGWNPHNYPCYYLNVTETEIFFYKHPKFPKTPTPDPALDSYQTFSNILSDDEWRNFIVSFDQHGTLKLIDANVNRTVIQYQDQQPLKPLYLLFKSVKPALWKVHQNQFIYTETPQTSRLGPILNLASKDLCVSLYVSTCENCAMRFIIMKDNKRKVLKEVEPTEKYQWKLVKLKEENVESEKLNIFVETVFVNATLNSSEGFWAVDNVRVCHENEVKVTFLKLKNSSTDEKIVENNVSCQVVQHPMWRPKKLVYGKIKDFPAVVTSSNATSINLSWAQEDPDKQINYFIQYEANDICTSEPFNLGRLKSSGFLMTKLDEITVNNLIPYTKYNITFSTMLHEQEKKLFVTTAESDKPTVEELPNKIQIQVTDSAAYVSWDKIDCKSVYGHILYAINITNNLANVTKELKVQTENTVEIDNLEPFTAYTMNIVTARSFENIQSNNNTIGMNINFTTKAGVAPPVVNLELYAIDKNSVAFRYDLPKKPKGVPVYVQVMRCNPIVFKKCKTSQFRIEKCKLWPKKYCVEVNNLIPYQRHTFKVSIKNIDSIFGDETVLDGFTQEQVPGAPTNMTYKVVDCKAHLEYCHLNVTWHHPYNQNGTITAFNIVLNSTNSVASENILEVIKISNKSYVPVYEHQIQYIPFSKQYDLYLQSVNVKFKSDFTHIHVKTADIGDHIDQSPKLLAKSSTAATFKVVPVDPRLKSYTMSVIVQDFDKSVAIPDDLDESFQDHLCHKFGNTWVSQTLEINNQTENITIGEQDGSKKTLEASTQYCVTFIITNKYKDTEHQVVYYDKMETPSSSSVGIKTGSSNQNHLYALLLLLLLIPIGFLLYRYITKRRPKKSKQQQQNQENVYESLPFEECEDNCVANETYDQLLHK